MGDSEKKPARYVAAEDLLRNVGVYVEMWRDGDCPYHSIGHIRQLFAEYDKAALAAKERTDGG